jgi:fructose-1,6-bisphosphatase II / sedoheptulose-1,7-bisphosphatase
MFDRAARAAWRVGAAPYVEIAVLTALATLLQDVTSVSGAPLFIGEKVGINAGPRVDIAVDPLEGTTLCAKNMPGAIATMAMADGGTLLHAPDVYMQKIAVGPGYAKGVVELDASPADNVRRLAKAKGVDPSAITVLVLDRPRHSDIIAGVRGTGAAVRLITDGDVAGVIHCADPDNTGVDMYIGTGGASEGVLAAAALRCIGGQMQCRLILDTEEKRERASKMGVTDPRMIYGIEDMAKGDCLFAATGVTDGSLLSGVKFRKDVIQTETVVMRSVTGTVRYIKAEHRQLEKFHLDRDGMTERGSELTLDVAVQRPHHAEAREHNRPTLIGGLN